jgi:chromosome segregation ATPase
MFKHHYLASLLAARQLTALFDRADDAKGGSGKPAPKSLEVQLAEVTASLTEAQATLSALTAERDTAQADLLKATGERDALQAQFDALTATATQTKDDLLASRAAVATLTTERDGLTSDLATSKANITRLEALCGIKGIDSKSAVPPDNNPEPVSQADFEAQIKSAKTPAERAAIASKFEAAVAQGRI